MPTIEKQTDSEWIQDELSEVSLGDKRLNWRLQDSAEKLASRPSVSINQACEDWADTKATYRLFDNKKTTAAKILLPHQERTKVRISGHKLVLAVQDTSYIDYSHHPRKEGLGPIGTEKQHLRGLVMHSTLALTPLALPLGILSQNLWARDEAAKPRTAAERKKMPIAEKESYKWIAALDESIKYLPPGTQCVLVGDSESDIFELFDHARNLALPSPTSSSALPASPDLLVRAAQDRAVCEPEVGRLWKCLEQRKAAGQLIVHLPERNGKPKREAIVTVRFSSITLRTPEHLRSRLKNCPLFAVLAWETNPPPDVEPLCWLLLTTVPVRSFADAQERIHWYCHRWKIEVFHKTLKSGCQIEKAQLEKAHRLLPLLTLFSIIAWHLFWMTYLARHEPDSPCTSFLTDPEWHSLYAFIHKTDLIPPAIPSTLQATRWIARLGGFLDRKRDGFPGVTVFWRGWQRLADISSTWLISHPQKLVGKG